MAKTVFHYFNLKAMGEGSRLLLAYGGEDFEDHRINFVEWPEIKFDTPFGQLPMIDFDGKRYAQSSAICRYLGHKYGLAGANIEEDLLIDQNYEFVNDIRAKAAIVHYEKVEEAQQKKQEDFAKNHYPFLLNKLDELIKQNNGYLALGKLTWADFAFVGMFDYVKMMLRMPDLEEQYPSFKKLKETVMSLPKVKEFIANTPEPLVDY